MARGRDRRFTRSPVGRVHWERSPIDVLLAAWATVLLLLAVGALVASSLGGGFGDGVVDPLPPSAIPAANFNYVSVSHQTRTIDAVLDVDLSSRWLASLRWVDDGEPVFGCYEGSCTALERFDGATLEDVTLEIEWHQSVGQVGGRESVALAQVGDLGVTTVSLPVELPAVGRPLHFPDDDYRTEPLLVRILVPSGITQAGETHGGQEWVQPVEIQQAAGLGDYSAEISVGYSARREDALGLGHQVVAARKPRVRMIIYAVAAAPLLLVAIAARQSVRMGRRGGGGRDLATLELAAALLAILPLREALVPDGVGGLTRLDYVLSGEVVAIIALVAFAALAPSAARADGQPGEGAASSTEPTGRSLGIPPEPHRRRGSMRWTSFGVWWGLAAVAAAWARRTIGRPGRR